MLRLRIETGWYSSLAVRTRWVPGTSMSAQPKSAVFGKEPSDDAIDHFLGSLSFGGGAINQVNIHLFVETMPFGGVGNSGIGNFYGKYGFDSMTHAKSILISPADVDIDHLFPPYTAEKVQALSQWFDY